MIWEWRKRIGGEHRGVRGAVVRTLGSETFRAESRDVIVEGYGESAVWNAGYKVTDPDTGIDRCVMFPEPAAGQDEPAVAEQVQVTPVNCAGNVSVTVAPTTAPGPKLDTVMRYAEGVPESPLDCPSVLVMARSAERLLTLIV